MSEPSLIHLPKSSHQENIHIETSSVHSPYKFYFLFILPTNSNHSCCLQITTFAHLHVYRWLRSAIPSFIPIWLLELFPIHVSPVLFGPFLPPVGRAVGKAGRSRCLGKSPKCIQTEAAVKENMHSQPSAFLILHSREERCFCYAICLGSFHYLSCITSYLTSFFFSHRSAAVSI